MSLHLTRIELHPERYPTRDLYPFNLDVFNRTPAIVFDSPVSFFVGENGTGKSTLLRAISRRCGIYIWGTYSDRSRFDVNPHQDALDETIDVAWADGSVAGSFFGSEIFRNYAQIVDEWASTDPGILEYYGGKSLMSQSHGQMLMSFFRSRFGNKGLFLLDEPEVGLSPATQIDLLRLLHHAAGAGRAQFIVATHSPILMACPGARLFSFDHAPVKAVAYEETSHYRLYQAFMTRRDEFLRI